jgi:F5/8 type C domain/Domain of unknown function (DUF1929)/Glyoxal oxidase N-terminus
MIKKACIVRNIISLFKRFALASVIVAVAPSSFLAQAQTNIALNKPVTASSVYSSSYVASYALDGNLNTRWSSVFSDPQWIYVDLGSTYNINEVRLIWETAYGKAYQIQVSNDATNWTSIYSTTTGVGGVDDLPGLSGTGRYVRMYGTQRGTPWGYSLWEFEVYGTAASGLPTASLSANPTSITAGQSSTLTWSSTNATSCTGTGFSTGNATAGSVTVTPSVTTSYSVSCMGSGGTATASATVGVTAGSANIALNKPATASSVFSSAYLPSYAFDGNLNTRWASAFQYVDPQWIYVDLGSAYNINEVKITWETAYALAYQIQVSNDATNWTSIYSTTTGTGGVNDVTGLSGTGRYVRMYGTQRSDGWAGYSLWEFEVYGTAASGLPTASLAANPTSITAGQSSTLTWGSTNATSCTGTGFSTGNATAGSVTVTPSVTTSYSVSCMGSGGTATASATVGVTSSSSQGQWSAVLDPTSSGLPLLARVNPIHAALLPNGTILIVAGSGNCPPSQSGCPTGAPYGPSNGSGATLYDPVARSFTPFSVSWDMFCNSMVLLPDGRALIAGGTTQYDPFHGAPNTSIFDPSTSTFTNVQNMAQGRWYPTIITLADGRAMTFSGLDGSGNTTSLVEIYSVGSGWTQVSCSSPGANCWIPPLYPRMHLLPNGKVFYSGSSTSSALFDPSTLTWSLNVANTNFASARFYGTSVLLPLTPANNYRPKVMIMGGYSPATATTEIIDLGAANPTWQNGPAMSQPRVEMNAVILPNGKVLALGGSANDEDVVTASLNADLYDPATNTFSSAGANAYPRLYHSMALLLPDATVWLAGGNPSRGSYEQRMEIYKPAYLFQSNGAPAIRPSISSAPSSISLGNQFTVQSPDAANISSVVLVRFGGVTHAFNADQRLVGMSFTPGAGMLTVTAPANHNIAPPGYYMLFLVNTSGVPSVASFIRLQ